MELPKRNFITNPSKKILILFTFLWLLGITLSTLSMTDLFTESFLQKKYVMTYFSMIGSTITIGVLYFFYWRNKKLNSHSTVE
ncbi:MULTISPECIES: hypothetical protein [Flavobacteriaceae]|uniref:hypothetical protein n=1 Tax=Flavobacteriaceae TaxID=49546 RepID=UPI0004800D50|nr:MULTISPECIES: hypothetical protein [Flavobacteriaceae]